LEKALETPDQRILALEQTFFTIGCNLNGQTQNKEADR